MKKQIGGDFTSFLLIIIVVLIVGGIGTLVAWKLGLIPGLGDDDGDGKKKDDGGGNGDGNNLNTSEKPPPPNGGGTNNNPSNFQYQTPLAENGFCSNDAGFIRQDVPGCGIICSSKDYVGRQDPDWRVVGDEDVRGEKGFSATWYDAQTKYRKIFYGDKQSNLVNCIEKAGIKDDGTAGPWSALSPTNLCPTLTSKKNNAQVQIPLRPITQGERDKILWPNGNQSGDVCGLNDNGTNKPCGDGWWNWDHSPPFTGKDAADRDVDLRQEGWAKWYPCNLGYCTEQPPPAGYASFCYKPLKNNYNDRKLNSGFSYSKKADSNSDNGDGDGDAN